MPRVSPPRQSQLYDADGHVTAIQVGPVCAKVILAESLPETHTRASESLSCFISTFKYLNYKVQFVPVSFFNDMQSISMLNFLSRFSINLAAVDDLGRMSNSDATVRRGIGIVRLGRRSHERRPFNVDHVVYDDTIAVHRT